MASWREKEGRAVRYLDEREDPVTALVDRIVEVGPVHRLPDLDEVLDSTASGDWSPTEEGRLSSKRSKYRPE